MCILQFGDSVFDRVAVVARVNSEGGLFVDKKGNEFLRLILGGAFVAAGCWGSVQFGFGRSDTVGFSCKSGLSFRNLGSVHVHFSFGILRIPCSAA